MSGTPLEPGEIVLVPFPFTDLTAAKSRPALVVSRKAYNAASDDVVLCGITSNLGKASHSVLISAADIAGAELPRPSRIKVDKIVTLRQSLIRRRFGSSERAR